MNSKQRRQYERKFPYKVTLRAESDMRYFEHDIHVDQAAAWCKKRFKEVRIVRMWDSADFYFTKGVQSTEFALRWIL